MTTGVPCPRCPAGPFTEPGRLAGHLVEVHMQSASVALADARRALQPTAAPRLTAIPASPASISPHPKGDVAMPKDKSRTQTCGRCSKTGHNARGCPDKVPTRPTRASSSPAPGPKLNKLGTPRGPLREIAGASNGALVTARAQDSAKAAALRLLDDALAEARAYVAELERLRAGA